MRISFERCWKHFERYSKAAATCFLLAAAADAQPFDLDPVHAPSQDVPDQAPGFVVIETVGPEAAILLNGKPLPTRATDAGWVLGPIEAGPVTLTIHPDGLGAWDGREAVEMVTIRPADTVRVVPRFDARTVLTSVPYGARVVLQREGETPTYLGTTPLRLDTEQPISGTLRVELDGYQAEAVPLSGAVTERHAVLLRPAVTAAEQAPVLGVYTYGEARDSGRRWIDYAAAGLAVAGAATAIYYKFEADAIDDRLRDANDFSRTDRAELIARRGRLDTTSLVGLGAMQLGVGVLAVRFVLR